MRDLLTTGLELVALGLIVAGVWLIFVPAAFIVAGAGLLAMSYVETRGTLR
jgi:hypothetical protein